MQNNYNFRFYFNSNCYFTWMTFGPIFPEFSGRLAPFWWFREPWNHPLALYARPGKTDHLLPKVLPDSFFFDSPFLSFESLFWANFCWLDFFQDSFMQGGMHVESSIKPIYSCILYRVSSKYRTTSFSALSSFSATPRLVRPPCTRIIRPY